MSALSLDCLHPDDDCRHPGPLEHEDDGGAGTIVALLAWKLIGYEFVIVFAAAVAFNIIAFAYSFGVRHGAAYIPSDDDVFDGLTAIMWSEESAEAQRKSISQ